MRLQILTLKKLAREALRTPEPLTLKKSGLTELKKRLSAWLAGQDDPAIYWYGQREGYDHRSLCSFSANDPDRSPYIYGGCTLGLDDQSRLRVALDYRTHHPVG